MTLRSKDHKRLIPSSRENKSEKYKADTPDVTPYISSDSLSTTSAGGLSDSRSMMTQKTVNKSVELEQTIIDEHSRNRTTFSESKVVMKTETSSTSCVD